MPLHLPARNKYPGNNCRVTGRRSNKFGAVVTVVDGIRFASKREATRYAELTLLQRAGEIHALELQPVFPLVTVCATTGEVHQVAVYKADFSYQDSTGCVIVEDVKSPATKKNAVYRLKRKMVEASYGITVTET